MSNIEVVAVCEPRVQLDNVRKWVALKGGQRSTPYQIPATSFSNSNISWTVIPPSKESILDRKVLIQLPVTLALTGSNPAGGGAFLLSNGTWGFRAHPIQRIMSSLSVSINGNTVSMEPSIVINAMERVHDPIQYDLGYNSVGPNYTDVFASYTDGLDSSNNALGQYADSAPINPRNAYPMTVTNNTTTTATVNATLYEYVMLPPMLFGSDSCGDIKEAGGLVMLDTYTVSATMTNNLARILSTADPVWGAGTVGCTITACGVTIGQPQLLVNWITPRLTEPIPREITYPYFQINRYTTSIGTIAPAATAMGISSNVIQLSSIPLLMYIYVKKSDNYVYATASSATGISDTFCSIQGVSFNFNNNSGLLSNASPMQLYQMSLDNGLSMSWDEWSGYTQKLLTTTSASSQTIGTVGSLLVIDPSKDFGLESGLATGSLGQYNFQVSNLNITNIDRNTATDPSFELQIICVYDGILSISGGSGTTQIGIASRADVLNAPTSSYDYNELRSLYGGGSFFSKFSDIAKGVNDFLRGSQVISKGLKAVDHPIAKTVGNIAHTFGYGEDAGVEAGVLEGGKLMSRKTMRHRLGL